MPRLTTERLFQVIYYAQMQSPTKSEMLVYHLQNKGIAATVHREYQTWNSFQSRLRLLEDKLLQNCVNSECQVFPKVYNFFDALRIL